MKDGNELAMIAWRKALNKDRAAGSQEPGSSHTDFIEGLSPPEPRPEEFLSSKP